MTASSKTPAVWDQHGFAQESGALGMGEVSQQSGFQPVLRRKLMAALSMTGRELGLRPASLMVLDTLLSFLPCTDAAGKEMPVTPLHLLTIYASNDTISFRARGLTDRQLRRHFDLLELRGLIQRRDSANGKRFPVYQNGKVVGAYGIDLMPLFTRSDDILARAAQLREEQQEIRGLKAQIGQLRAKLLAEAPALPQTALHFLEKLRNLTRRVGLTVIEAKALLAQLKGYLHPRPTDMDQHSPAPSQIEETGTQSHSTCASNKMSAPAGQNVRHNKPKNSYTKKYSKSLQTENDQPLWSKLTSLAEFFPDHPKSLHELTAVLQRTAEMLRIDKALYHRAVSFLPPLQLAQVLDRILRHHDRIRSPDAYLQALLQSEAF